MSDDNAEHVGSIQLKNQTLPANFVIMGTGVSPATGYLKDSGFNLEEDGGIKVDKNLRVEGHKDIYAIGDIAHYLQHPDYFPRRVEHWNVAGNHVSSHRKQTR